MLNKQNNGLPFDVSIHSPHYLPSLDLVAANKRNKIFKVEIK